MRIWKRATRLDLPECGLQKYPANFAASGHVPCVPRDETADLENRAYVHVMPRLMRGYETAARIAGIGVFTFVVGQHICIRVTRSFATMLHIYMYVYEWILCTCGIVTKAYCSPVGMRLLLLLLLLLLSVATCDVSKTAPCT